jgi:hypothetical protein
MRGAVHRISSSDSEKKTNSELYSGREKGKRIPIVGMIDDTYHSMIKASVLIAVFRLSIEMDAGGS